MSGLDIQRVDTRSLAERLRDNENGAALLRACAAAGVHLPTPLVNAHYREAAAIANQVLREELGDYRRIQHGRSFDPFGDQP